MNNLGRYWLSFTRWRRTRPFWGGALIILGAGIIISVPTIGGTVGATFTEGIAGVSGVLIALLMMVSGFTMWISPSARVYAGVAGCFLSLVAVVASNLGGFLFGTIFGLVGAAMAIAWTPTTIQEQKIHAKEGDDAPAPAYAYAGAAPEVAQAGSAAPVTTPATTTGTYAPAPTVVTGEELFDPFPEASFSAPTEVLEGEIVQQDYPPVPGRDDQQPRWGVGGE